MPDITLGEEIAITSPGVVASGPIASTAETLPGKSQPLCPDTELETRAALAEQYFMKDLEGQQKWYDARATSCKTRSELLGLLIIILGASIPFIQVFGNAKWVAVASGAIGALVAILAGWQRIARYTEIWVGYRTASEKMKHERRLYLHGAGHYRALSSTDAYLLLIESIEATIAEEQKIYWQRHDGDSSASLIEKRSTGG
jgi:hypothetical protein